MSALDGFYSTWNKAKDTFGVGTPTDGSQYNGSSSQLLKMKSSIESASKHDGWQGTGADAYAAANKEHAGVYEKLADLDKKMAAEVTNAANVVTNGRNQLDTTKSWVDSAVNALPQSLNSQAREKSLIPIAKEGITQVNTTVSNANGAMLQIGIRVNELKNGFDELQNQKLGPGSDKAGEKKGDSSEDPQKKAEEDVRKMLRDGDQSAAARVDDVLDGIDPHKELSPEQDAYLRQLETQQKNMSVDELTTAKEKLGDRKDVLGDSWQLMSNDDVGFGEPNEKGERPKGSFDRLPDSVQKSLSNDNLIGYPGDEVERQKVEAIADIVRDGDAKFQDGTEIDRAMIRLSDRLMDESPNNQETVRELFTSAGRDHQVVTDHLVGHQPYLNGPEGTVPYDYNSDDFLSDIMTTGWADNGTDAGTLFDWTNNNDGKGPEVNNASAAAEIYAQFIGSHKDELMDVSNMFGMTDTLGQHNPELVKAMAHGLTPYMADIAAVDGGANDNFGNLSTEENRKLAKGIFSVLGTQVDAYSEFNGKANELALTKAYEWANEAANHGPVIEDDRRIIAAATLKGLVDAGTSEGLHTIGLDMEEANELKKEVYNQAVDALSKAPGPWGKGIGLFGEVMGDSFIGNTSDIPSGRIDEMPEYEGARFVANALMGVGVELPELDDYVREDKDLPGHPQRIASFDDLGDSKPSDDKYQDDLNRAIERVVGHDKNPVDTYLDRWRRIAGEYIP